MSPDIRAAIGKALTDPRAQCEGDWSRLIYRCVAFLEAMGLTVNLYDEDLHHGGQVAYASKLVRLNAPNAQNAALTVAHEAGHWISYLLMPEKYVPEHDNMGESAEDYAYTIGWLVLMTLDTERLVSWDMWKDFHSERQADG